jgi:hypothetical protein
MEISIGVAKMKNHEQNMTQDTNQVAKKDFFISYNKADRHWAEWIAWQLEENGFTTFLQTWDFSSGSNFVVEMDKATKGTERTIAVLSPDYLTSLYTLPEWANAFAEDPTGSKRKLVPVRVRKCEIKGLLAPILYIDLVGQDLSSARERLLQDVGVGRHKPNTEPAFPGAEAIPPATTTVSSEHALRLLQGEPPFPKDLPPTTKAIQVFYSYAQQDKDLLVNMEKQLVLLKRLGLITDWHDDRIRAGQETKREIEKHFSSAQIILLLVSANFMASETCYDIAKRAMDRRRAGTAEIIPIIIKPVDWRGAPFEGLDVLPKNKKPITSWSDREEAFFEVSQGIREVVEALQAKPS